MLICILKYKLGGTNFIVAFNSYIKSSWNWIFEGDFEIK